jgi:hypothetical protein
MSIVCGFERICRDVGYSWRTAIANPAFTLVAVSSLAPGIGANTSSMLVGIQATDPSTFAAIASWAPAARAASLDATTALREE